MVMWENPLPCLLITKFVGVFSSNNHYTLRLTCKLITCDDFYVSYGERCVALKMEEYLDDVRDTKVRDGVFYQLPFRETAFYGLQIM